MKHGPNVNRVIIERASVLAIPKGGGIAAGIRFFTDEKRRRRILTQAEKWTMEAIAVVKTAPDNTYQTDEEIAGAILAKIEEKKRRRRLPGK